MAGQDARECALSRMADVDCRHSRLVPDTLLSVVVLDFSGKLQKTTLAVSLEAFLSETGQIERLRPHTLRAYRYELCTNQP